MSPELIMAILALAGVIFSSYMAYRNSRATATAQSKAQDATNAVELRKVDRDDFITYTDKVTADMQKMQDQLRRATGLLHTSLTYIRDLRMAVLDNRRPLPEIPKELRELEWFLDDNP